MKSFLEATLITTIDRTPLGAIYASDIKVRNKRIYIRFGHTGFGEYDGDAFLARLDRGEALRYPFAQNHGSSPERLLNPEIFFNVYTMTPVGNADALGSEALKDFDVDSAGAVYVAATQGFAIVIRGEIVFQDNREQTRRVIALKGATKRYALRSSKHPTLFDCTNPAAPVELAARVPDVLDYAKSADDSRVAIIDFATHKLSIYTADGLATGAPPIYLGLGATSVTSDGTRFYVLQGTSIEILTPSGNTYTSAPAGSVEMQTPVKITYGDGRIVVAGSGSNGAWAWNILSVEGSALKRIPFDASATVNNQGVNALSGIVYNGRPILCGNSRGDVYDALAPVVVVVPDVPPVPPADKPGAFIQEHDVTYRRTYKDDPAGRAAAQAQYESMAGVYNHYILGKDNLGRIVILWY